jgi:DNA end-binding protein Ku
MRETGKVAIAKVVIRQKEALVAVRPHGDLLQMDTLIYFDEIVPPDRLDDLPDEAVEVTDRELAIAKQLVESLATGWTPEQYQDEYREKVLQLIEQKAAGEEVAVQPVAEQAAPVPDLMSALKASLDAVRERPGGEPEGAAPKTRKKPAAKRRAGKPDEGGPARSQTKREAAAKTG